MTDIIGGGEEGGKTLVRTREEGDHSLPYLLAGTDYEGFHTRLLSRTEEQTGGP